LKVTGGKCSFSVTNARYGVNSELLEGSTKRAHNAKTI